MKEYIDLDCFNCASTLEVTNIYWDTEKKIYFVCVHCTECAEPDKKIRLEEGPIEHEADNST